MVTELERSAAIAAVGAAAQLTDSAQGRLVAGDTLTKGDESPVTVADFGAQAVVCSVLAERLGGFDMVGEEDATDLTDHAQTGLLGGVVGLVGRQRGVEVPPSQVVDWIAMGDADGTGDRYWTLDPIDGTKGFLRGDQYAIALALIEAGEVVLGVLGYPHRNDTIPGKTRRISPLTQTMILSGIAIAVILLATHMLLTRSYIASGIPLLALIIAWMTLFR